MDLIEVDVIGAKAFEARLDLTHDPKPRRALFVRAIPRAQAHLARQDDLVAMAGNGLSYEHLARQDDLVTMAGNGLPYELL